MDKLLKKLVAMICLVTLFTSMEFGGVGIIAVQAAGHTRDEAVNWATSKIGQGLDYDGVYGCQCVDLIAYYYDYFGVASYATGNANAYITNSLPAGWTRVYGDYQPGDIAVWKTDHSCSTCNTTSLGHVGIITSADSVGFNAINQNFNNQSYCSQNWFKISSLACAIRPSYSSGDSQAPVITDITVTNKTSKGYTVTCTVNDNVGVTEVKFPTWRVSDGSTGCTWYQGTKNGNRWTFTFSDASYEDSYLTHIYAYDAAGNYGYAFVDVQLIDKTAPKISDIEVKDVTSDGYTITCKVSDNNKISKVEFPTWTVVNGQDDLTWYDGAIDGDTASIKIDASKHDNMGGRFSTHIYAYDESGNLCTSAVSVTVPVKYTPVDVVTYDKHIYAFFENMTTYEEASVACESMGGHLYTQDDNDEKNIVEKMITDRGKNVGDYITGNNNLLMGDGFVLEIDDDLNAVVKGNFEGKEIYVYDVVMPFKLAKAYCELNDGRLAVIDSEEKNSYVKSLITSEAAKMQKYYFGLYRDSITSEWKTIDGEKQEYFNWSDCQPDNYRSIQKYGTFYRESKWDDEYEYKNKTGFIFEKEQTEEPTTEEPTTEEPTTEEPTTEEPTTEGKLISTDMIRLSTTEYNWDGKEKKPDVIVEDGEKVLTENVDYTVEYEEGRKNVGFYVVSINGIGEYSGCAEEGFSISLYKGETYVVGGMKYRMLSADTDSIYDVVRVSIAGTTISGLRALVVKDGINIGGVTCKITEIKPNSFKKNTKLKKVIIGKNITKIGKMAFYKCNNLKTIQVNSTKLKSVGKYAIKGIHKRAVIKVPEESADGYKGIFSSSTGFGKYMSILL